MTGLWYAIWGEMRVVEWKSVLKYPTSEARSLPKDVKTNNQSYFDDDVNQQFHLRLLEFVTRHGVEIESERYVEHAFDYVADALLAQHEATGETDDDEPLTAEGKCWGMMRDAQRDMRQLHDDTPSRRRLRAELVSWDIDKLDAAMSATVNGLPTTGREFETYDELELAVQSDIAKQYELSDAATDILTLFQNGTTAQRRALLHLVQAAKYIEQGAIIPNSLRSKLKRDRKEVKAMGWELDLDLLR